MSHRDTRQAARRPASPSSPSSTASPVAAFEDPGRGIYAIQFHPEVAHTPFGQQILTTFLEDDLRRRPQLERGVDRRRADRSDPRAGRGRPRDLRALGRRRLVGRRAARPPRDRRPADVRLRRPRPDAKGRGRAGDRGVPRHLQGAAGRRRRGGALPRAARRRHRPGGQAQGDRRGVHPRLRGGGGEALGRPLPRPGHALLRRDRVGRAQGLGDDQVPPQRRRPPRRPRVRARRAAADAVQGRGARRRRRARPARAPRLAPAVPGPRARDPHRRRRGDQGSASTCCATPTTSSRTRSARPASTASSGSPSASFPTSAPSASRATSAPTAT